MCSPTPTGPVRSPIPLACGLTPTQAANIISASSKTLYALAVRPADVTAAVPEPQTLALTLIALAGVLVVRRRRAA
ncbi:PEP-CTERM sorting domain-containing protein [Roseateles sp. GG27B]